MSVEYEATLGYGLLLPEEIPHPNDVGVWEIIEDALVDYPLVSYETGGGGYSNTGERYVLFIKSTVQELTEIDGVITLKKPTITDEAKRQLEAAYMLITDDLAPKPQWIIAGGFY